MRICDSCKKVERCKAVISYTFGLHLAGKPCEGSYLSFNLDLCDKCKDKIASGYIILDCWKKLCNEQPDNPIYLSIEAAKADIKNILNSLNSKLSDYSSGDSPPSPPAYLLEMQTFAQNALNKLSDL